MTPLKIAMAGVARRRTVDHKRVIFERKLVHCTVCGVIHKMKECPSCGDASSQRAGVGSGTEIYMTVGG